MNGGAMRQCLVGTCQYPVIAENAISIRLQFYEACQKLSM